MLKEIFGLADDPPARRRWFHDDYFDLFVWQAHGEVTLFQLCYGLDSSERALVWDKQRGFFHDGATTGAPASGEVVRRFHEAAGSLPEEIRAAISPRLREFVELRPTIAARRKRFRRAPWQA